MCCIGRNCSFWRRGNCEKCFLFLPASVFSYLIRSLLVQEAFSSWDANSQMLLDRLEALLGQCNRAQDQLHATREDARRLPSHSAVRAAIFAGTDAQQTRLGCAAATALAGAKRVQAASLHKRKEVLTERVCLPRRSELANTFLLHHSEAALFVQYQRRKIRGHGQQCGGILSVVAATAGAPHTKLDMHVWLSLIPEEAKNGRLWS